MTALTDLSRRVRALADGLTDNPIADARSLVPLMDEILTDRVADETAIRLWVQVLRAATGEQHPAPADRETARTACLTALAPPKHPGGRPAIHGPRVSVFIRMTEAQRTATRAAAEDAGMDVNAWILQRLGV